MKLGEAQRMFTRLLPRLLDRAQELHPGQVVAGELERHKVAAEWLAKRGLGTRSSLHCSRLAIDLHLFSPTGEYLTSTEAHRALGEWWEAQHELCRWGGRFKRADGNHYSIAWEGRA